MLRGLPVDVSRSAITPGRTNANTVAFAFPPVQLQFALPAQKTNLFSFLRWCRRWELLRGLPVDVSRSAITPGRTNANTVAFAFPPVQLQFALPAQKTNLFSFLRWCRRWELLRGLPVDVSRSAITPGRTNANTVAFAFPPVQLQFALPAQKTNLFSFLRWCDK